mgnify:CR=1 FL=1|tara:strand:+ start:4681 stop:7290 length:2610 start_codon:yes stop_codon:yes gene_type:complete
MTVATETIEKILDSLLESNQIAPILATSTQSLIRSNIFSFSEGARTVTNPSGWDTFITIEETDSLSLVSKLNSGGNSMRSFRNMTTLEASQIIPRIRLYKVFIDGDTRKQTHTVPIPFPDSQKQNLESMMKSKDHRGDDIVLKSVSLDFRNQNPVMAGVMTDCSIVLTMQNGESLTKARSSQGKTFRYTDLILRNRQTNPEKHDSDYYEIKLVLGYESPKDAINKQLVGDLAEQQIVLSLYLTDYNISFEQNGVMELTLDYKGMVQAKLEKPIRYNIFKEEVISVLPSLQDDLAKLEKSIENDTGKLAEAESKFAAAKSALEETTKGDIDVPTIGDTGVKDVRATYVENRIKKPVLEHGSEERTKVENTKEIQAILIEKLKVRIDDNKTKKIKTQNDLLFISAKNRIAKFNRIMTNLFRKGKVYRTVIKRKDLLLFGSAYEKAIERKIDAAAGNVLEVQELLAASEDKRSQASKFLEDQIKAGTRAKAPIGIRTKEAIAKAAKQAGKKPLASAEANALISSNVTLRNEPDSKSVDRGDKIIYWFYYGDLLEEALKLNNVHINMRNDQIIPTLGSFNLTDQKSGKSQMISIPDVPITVDSFMEFFKDNIINPGRDVYACQDFIRDTVQRLVTPSINAMAFGNQQKETRTLKVTEFMLPASKKGKSYFEPITEGFYGRNPGSIPSFATSLESAFKAGRVDIADVTKLSSKSKLASRSAKGIYSYILFYATNADEQVSWKGNIKEDVKRGIYHHYVGADKGLVKSISFAKDQRPYIAEMQAEKALRSGDKYVELWRNFRATLDMVGNALYVPGQYLYINPTVAGLGDPRKKNSLSRKLGLGGYYLVLNVSNNFQNGQWSTSVESQWQSSPPA